MHLLLNVVLAMTATMATALVNHTVDDTYDMVHYSGGSWEHPSAHASELDFGGSHTVSASPGARAAFTFTGEHHTPAENRSIERLAD
jgi:hypothetical protein